MDRLPSRNKDVAIACRIPGLSKVRGNMGSALTRLFNHSGHYLARQSKVARLKSFQQRSDTAYQSLALGCDQNARQTDRGYGGGNRGRYSSATADEYIEEAEQQMDLDKRKELYGKALEIFHNEDVGLMPLYFQVGVWGVKTGITFEPRMDQGTVLRDVVIDY